MIVGTADDTVRQQTLVAAKAKMDQLRMAGFDAVRISDMWTPGAVAPPADDLATIKNVAAAANLYGMELFVAVHNAGSRTTPSRSKNKPTSRPTSAPSRTR